MMRKITTSTTYKLSQHVDAIMTPVPKSLLRGPFNEPDSVPGSSGSLKPRLIHFIHPGYHEGKKAQIKDVLISLPAFDDEGVYYDTAHVACAMLAANRWDGFFSTTQDGSARVSIPVDCILRENTISSVCLMRRLNHTLSLRASWTGSFLTITCLPRGADSWTRWRVGDREMPRMAIAV